MQNDPAFLFYYRDFISQTRFYSDGAIGMLMRILCAQAEHGHLPGPQLKSLNSTDENQWGEIAKRFLKDADGLWYDEWLEKIQQERKLRVDKKLMNLKKKADRGCLPGSPIGNPDREAPLANANANASEDATMGKVFIPDID